MSAATVLAAAVVSFMPLTSTTFNKVGDTMLTKVEGTTFLGGARDGPASFLRPDFSDSGRSEPKV